MSAAGCENGIVNENVRRIGVELSAQHRGTIVAEIAGFGGMKTGASLPAIDRQTLPATIESQRDDTARKCLPICV